MEGMRNLEEREKVSMEKGKSLHGTGKKYLRVREKVSMHSGKSLRVLAGVKAVNLNVLYTSA